MTNERNEATRIWNNGKEMRFSLAGQKKDVISSFQSIENRDNGKVSGGRTARLIMKIISLNVRGLGGSIKRNYVRDLIRKEHVEIVCLQETKCFEFSKESVFLLWGSNDIDWVVNGASNSFGGLITIWRKICFQMSSFFNGMIFFYY